MRSHLAALSRLGHRITNLPHLQQQVRRSSDLTASPCDGLILTSSHGGSVLTVTLDRPDRYNAINLELFQAVPDVLDRAASAEEVRAVVVTGGRGKFYSSGFDLAEIKKVGPGKMSPAEFAAQARSILQRFVGSFVDFPKPLLAAVNGPAVGVTVTTLALCDAAWCAERATFATPFSKTAQSIEGCASVLFPGILGQSLSNEMLLFDRTLTSSEALKAGLVSAVIPGDDLAFLSEVDQRAGAIAALPPGAVANMKAMLRDREALQKVNAEECAILEQRWQSEEFKAAMLKFFTRKKK